MHEQGDGEAFVMVALGWVGVLVYILMKVLNGGENRESSLDLQLMHDATSASTVIMPTSSQCFTYSVSRRCNSSKPY